MKSRIYRIWQNELYRIRSVLVFGGMGTAALAVGTLVNKGGYNPEVRVRGGRAAHTWRAGRGAGQGRGGGRTRRTGAPLRVGKGHHVVPALHFQTLFCFPLGARAPARCLCVCFRRAARLRRSLLSPSASPLCTASPFCACIALCCSSCKWFSRRTTPPLLLDVHV